LHLFVVIAGMVGLPYVQKERIPPKPIMIEIVDIGDITTTDKKPAPQRPKKPTVEEAPKEQKKIKSAPKVEAKEPPKIKPLEKPKVKEDTVKPKADTPPPPPKEKLDKPKPPPPEKKKKKEEKKKPEAVQQEDPLASLLKNLQDEETSNGDLENKDKPAEEKQAPDAVFSNKLTITQIDAMVAKLRTQFAGCWGVVAGAREAEKIAVVLLITVNPDRTVKNVRVQDQWRYSNNSFYRAAADAARRAVYHPDCKVLDVPPDYYDEWKEIEFNFDPAEML